MVTRNPVSAYIPLWAKVRNVIRFVFRFRAKYLKTWSCFPHWIHWARQTILKIRENRDEKNWAMHYDLGLDFMPCFLRCVLVFRLAFRSNSIMLKKGEITTGKNPGKSWDGIIFGTNQGLINTWKAPCWSYAFRIKYFDSLRLFPQNFQKYKVLKLIL